jgi:hypothetical protein
MAVTSASRPRRAVVVRAVVAAFLVLMLLTAAAVLLARRDAELTDRAELRETWAAAVEEWRTDALDLVPEPAIRTAPLLTGAATETEQGVADVEAECDRAASAAAVVAAADPAPPRPEGLPADARGAEEVAEEVAATEAALATYDDDIQAAATPLNGLCALYPDLARVGLDQSAALTTLTASLGGCDLAEVGCLPRDRTAWSGVADAVGPAYVEPERRRADLWTNACPTAELAQVCAALAADSATRVGLYETYAQAVRDSSDTAIARARDDLVAHLAVADVALAAAVAPLVPLVPPGADQADPSAEPLAPGVAVAQALRAIALDSDAAWLAADDAVMMALD